MPAAITHFAACKTAAEALNAAGLNWDVCTEPVISSKGVPFKNRLLTIREDTGQPLGVVSNRYEVLQNRDAFTFLDRLTMDPNGPKYVSAGCLYGGRKVLLIADLGGLDVLPGDEVRKQLILAHSHDGTMSVMTMLSAIRMACYNQLGTICADANRNNKIYRVRHTSSITNKLENVRDALGFINAQFDETAEIFQALTRVEPTKEQVDSVLRRLFPDTKREGRAELQRSRVLALAEAGKGNDRPGVRGTAWGLYNGITELVDHHNGKTSKREDRDDYQTDSKLFGLGAKLKARALTEIATTCLN